MNILHVASNVTLPAAHEAIGEEQPHEQLGERGNYTVDVPEFVVGDIAGLTNTVDRVETKIDRSSDRLAKLVKALASKLQEMSHKQDRMDRRQREMERTLEVWEVLSP